VTVEISTLVTLGIAVAGLVLGILSFILLIVNRRDLKDYATKQELANLKQQFDSIRELIANTNEWKQGVALQLGRLDGKIEANEKKGTEK